MLVVVKRYHLTAHGFLSIAVVGNVEGRGGRGGVGRRRGTDAAAQCGAKEDRDLDDLHKARGTPSSFMRCFVVVFLFVQSAHVSV